MSKNNNPADNALIALKKSKESDAVEQMRQVLPGLIPEDDQVELDVEAELDSEGGNMSDEELLAVIEIQKNRARSHIQDEISIRAAISNEYYLAQPTGIFESPQTGGRSNYVDTSVADTVNWLLPPLLDVFCGQDDIVTFSARNPAQEKSAEMTTAMVNHVWQQEAGFAKARTWIHDALMQPGGIIKCYWEPDLTPETTEFKGITDLQFGAFAAMAEAGECAIVAHKIRKNPAFNVLTTIQHGLSIANAVATGKQPQLAAPQAQNAVNAAQNGQNPLQAAQSIQVDPTDTSASQTLHDVKVYFHPDANSTNRGNVRIENIPLEEFYFDSQAPSLEKTNYVAHARKVTVSDLRAMGFDEDKLSETSDLEFDPQMSLTYLERHELDQTYVWSEQHDDVDPSMRRVIVVESYLKVDYDKDGLAEWRKVITCGNEILLNEPCDGHPFIMLVSNPLPHLAFGVSVAEQAQNIQLNMTQLMRASIDNVQLGANSQMFAVDGEVNLDDLLDSKPGGIVRVKTPASVGVLQTSSGDIAATTTLMEALDSIKQERTGVQKLTQGSDADIINETATGYQAMTERAEQRIKLMARQFAETGFKPLALRIQKLLAQFQNEYMQVRLNGQTVEADPMDACNQYDLIARVGLGTNDKSREMAYLTQILGMQQQAIAQATGMADLNNVHNTVEKLVRAMGFPNVEEFFSKPPAPMPQPPQPQMPPEVQAKIQIEQMQAQNDAQRQERQAQLDAMRIQAQAKNDDQQAMLAHQREMQKLQTEADMQREKLYLQAAIQREQAALQAMVSPQDEQAMFNETFQSTKQSMDDALTKINLHASGDYANLINAISSAPEPDQQGQ